MLRPQDQEIKIRDNKQTADQDGEELVVTEADMIVLAVGLRKKEVNVIMSGMAFDYLATTERQAKGYFPTNFPLHANQIHLVRQSYRGRSETLCRQSTLRGYVRRY